jgi:hypothetical protein
MKAICFFLCVIFNSSVFYAQTKLIESQTPITVYLGELKDIPAESKSNLENKLRSFIANNGFGNLYNSRFILTANVVVENKEYTSTSPVMIATTLGVYLYIGDGIDGTIFSAANIKLKGAGTTDIKSYNSAFSKLNLGKEEYTSFLSTAKNKIIQYYSENCDFLIKKANQSSLQGDYKKALYDLASIPVVDTLCSEKIEKSLIGIYQLMIDNECQKKLQNAKAIWSVEMNTISAEKASKEIMNISSQSKCFGDAQLFVDEMKKRILEIDTREWDFQLLQESNINNIQLSEIEAARQVGIAYGSNQPQNINYNISGWW